MKKTRLTTIKCFVIFALTSSGCLAQDDDFTQQQKVKGLNMLKQMSLADRARFVFRGEVVDENGEPLDNVTLTCNISRSTGEWGKRDRETTTHRISGTFLVEIEDASAVSLNFSREGYREAKLSFTYSLSGEDEASILSEEKTESAEIIREDLRVVLHKIGKLADLHNYSAALEYRVDGQGVVVDINKQPQYYKRDRTEVVRNVHDEDQLPPSAIYVTASTNENNQISTVPISNPKTGTISNYPKKLTIRFADPNSGFVMFDPVEGMPVATQMTTAPEAGYVRELIVSGQELADLRHHGSQNNLLWFFFKLEDKYGKGGIGISLVDDNRTSIKLHIGLKVQPDGSRNVETEM